MRTIIGIYRQLGKYIEVMDAEAVARGEGPEDKSIDVHFRSGVYLGNGFSHLILSLMPGKLATLVELFGYKGDRQTALEYLNKSGGWTKDSDEPSVDICESIFFLLSRITHRIYFTSSGRRTTIRLRHGSLDIPSRPL